MHRVSRDWRSWLMVAARLARRDRDRAGCQSGDHLGSIGLGDWANSLGCVRGEHFGLGGRITSRHRRARRLGAHTGGQRGLRIASRVGRTRVARAVDGGVTRTLRAGAVSCRVLGVPRTLRSGAVTCGHR